MSRNANPRPATRPARLTLTEAADAIGVHRRTLERYIKAGRLTAYRVGPRLVRVDPDEVEALLVPIPVPVRRRVTP